MKLLKAKKWPVKTFYYSDELNDDFAVTGKISDTEVGEDYAFTGKTTLWKTFSALLYRAVATPIVFVYCKLLYGVKFKNRRALKKIKGGFFLYGNHTQYVVDAFLPTLVPFRKRGYVITGRQAVSLPVVKTLVKMLGGIPLPSGTKGIHPFYDAVESKIAKGSVVTIYPEAHIWPYYTGIRPFGSNSFMYPVRMDVPAVAFTVTYRRRRIFKNRRPLITVTVSEPFYPDKNLPPKKARESLRDEVYGFMKTTASASDCPEYYKYIKRE